MSAHDTHAGRARTLARGTPVCRPPTPRPPTPRLATSRAATPRVRLGALVWCGCVAGLLAGTSPARAHSFALAHVDVHAVDATHATITLKTPEVGGHVPTLSVVTEGCETLDRSPARVVPGAVVDRLRVSCPGGVAGIVLGVQGLGGEVSEALVTLRLPGAEPHVRIVDSAEPQVLTAPRDAEGPPAAHAPPAAGAYLGLGATHMFGGLDHLLFVLGLLLVLAQRARVHGTPLLRPLAGTLTAFTLAHSFTLGLSALGVFGLPSRPVELVIALSILLLAVELVGHGQSADTLTYRRPQLVAFAFGLLHGFGFAGALGTLGLPEGAALPALLFFNLGVELAQLAFVALLLLASRLLASLLARARLDPLTSHKKLSALLGHGLGALAAYWVIARSVQLLFHGPLS